MKQADDQKSKTEKRFLTYHFTNEEKQNLGEDLADMNQSKKRLTNELKSLTNAKKAEISKVEERMEELSDKIRTGEEGREIECNVIFHFPKEDMKIITRKDTGEQWVEPMNENDYDLFNMPGASISFGKNDDADMDPAF